MSRVAVMARLGAVALVWIAMWSSVPRSVDAQVLRRGAVKRAVLDLSVPPSDDPAWDLSFVRDMVVDAAGRMYVLEHTDQSVRVYDAAGRQLRKLGRKGSGPGEFTYAWSLAIQRDSLWVLEHHLKRVSGFPLGGRAARTFLGGRGARTFVVTPKVRTGSEIAAVLATGFLAQVGTAVERPSGQSGGVQAYVTLTADGTVVDTVIAPQPPPPPLTFVMRRVGGPAGVSAGTLHAGQPFARQLFWGATPDGTRMLAISERAGLAGTSSELRLAAITLRGDTIWSRTLRCEPLAITPAHLRTVIDSLARPLEFGKTMVAGDRQMISDSLYKPPTWPIIAGMKIGVDGTILLKQGGPTSGGHRFWRLSSTGEFETSVEVPAGFTLMQASREKLWGWRLDSDGLPRIERYSY